MPHSAPSWNCGCTALMPLRSPPTRPIMPFGRVSAAAGRASRAPAIPAATIAARMPDDSAPLELRRRGEERHLVVGRAQAPRQGPHPVPQELVREVAIDEQQVLEV